MKKLSRPLLLILVAVALLALADVVSRHLSAASGREAPAAPAFSPAPGLYPRGMTVQLAPSQSRGQVLFSTDGSAPTATVGLTETALIGARYTRPLRLDAAFPGVTVLRAVETVGGAGGPVASASYVVGLGSGLPIVSLIADPTDLWDTERGLLTHPTFRGLAWERLTHVTLFEPGGGVVAQNAGLRVHNEASDAPKPSLRLYFRSEYGAARLEVALFPDHPAQPEQNQTYKRLLLQAGETAPRWTLLRDQLVTEVANDLGLPAAQGRFVWLFVNGESWGLYRLTERITRFFLDETEGAPDADVVQEGAVREGTDADWEALVDWAAGSDLSDPDAFALAEANIALDNFTDFAILQQVFAFPADALYAVHPPGERWYFVYGGGGRDESGGDFAILRTALLKNPAYRARFQARLADLLNTALAPEALTARLASLTAALDADFDYERARWPGTATLAEERAALEAQIAARPAQLWENFTPQGAAEVRFTLTPPEGGRVYVNGTPLPDADWSGQYPLGAALDVIAVPAPGYALTPGPAQRPLAVNGDVVYEAHFIPAQIVSIVDSVIINEVWINDNGTRYAGVAYRPITGDWVELLVGCPGPVDVRGWRLTGNATKAATGAGSVIFPQLDALAAVPGGTVILILTTENDANAENFPADDLDARDGRLIFYVGNGNLDVTTDPGFGLRLHDDALALLAPGPTADFGDDVGVDFVAEGREVTPHTFGILADGVTWDAPFRALGRDDGAAFVGRGRNDALHDWAEDPSACLSGDALCADAANVVTPGALNPGQWGLRVRCRFTQKP